VALNRSHHIPFERRLKSTGEPLATVNGGRTGLELIRLAGRAFNGGQFLS